MVTVLRALVVLVAVAGWQARAQELTHYADEGVNEIGEREIQLTVERAGKEALRLMVPQPAVDAEAWKQRGELTVDWRNCRTREMLAGRGELTQCVRRAFLAVNGEGDVLAPGSLDVTILPDGRVRLAYVPTEEGAPAPFVLVAGTAKAGDRWQKLVAGLDRAALAKHATADASRLHPTSFIFFGDSGTGTSEQYDVARGLKRFCETETCSFALLLGDNIYENGVSDIEDRQWRSKFEDPYRDLGFAFYPVLGNHDHRGAIQAQIDYTARSEKWLMPGRYYDFERGDVAFFAIDSDDFDSAQAGWLERRLQGTQRRWKIVYAHHPVFSYGEHGDTSDLKRRLLPLLTEYDVDFFLSGHDHDKQVILKEDVVFVVSGAGAKLRDTRRGDGTLFASSTLGFSHLTIDGDEARLRVLDKDGGVQYEKVFPKTLRDMPRAAGH